MTENAVRKLEPRDWSKNAFKTFLLVIAIEFIVFMVGLSGVEFLGWVLFVLMLFFNLISAVSSSWVFSFIAKKFQARQSWDDAVIVGGSLFFVIYGIGALLLGVSFDDWSMVSIMFFLHFIVATFIYVGLICTVGKYVELK